MHLGSDDRLWQWKRILQPCVRDARVERADVELHEDVDFVKPRQNPEDVLADC